MNAGAALACVTMWPDSRPRCFGRSRRKLMPPFRGLEPRCCEQCRKFMRDEGQPEQTRPRRGGSVHRQPQDVASPMQASGSSRRLPLREDEAYLTICCKAARVITQSVKTLRDVSARSVSLRCITSEARSLSRAQSGESNQSGFECSLRQSLSARGQAGCPTSQPQPSHTSKKADPIYHQAFGEDSK